MDDYDSYYDLLDVDRDASLDEIQAAYRKKVKEYHPDVNDDANAEELFKAITDAKETLTDTAKREQYNKTGHTTYTTRNDTDHNPDTKTSRDASQYAGWTPPPEEHTSKKSHQQATDRNNKQSHDPHTPDSDDWVGKPGWSEQPSSTAQTTHQTTATHSSTETVGTTDTPTYVIPSQQLTPAIFIALCTYSFSVYGFFSPTATPEHSLLGTLLFPLVFIVLIATRLGFYVFPTGAIATPLFLIWATPIQMPSIILFASTLLPICGIILTLLVNTIRPY